MPPSRRVKVIGNSDQKISLPRLGGGNWGPQ
jgi:hypothetical protein